ncbi:Putative AC transposase [Linum grandiflorum]
MVDHLYFKILCNGLQPLFKVPSRNTTRKDILTMYEIEKKKIQRVIDENKGRIVITTDMWTTTNQKRGYMAITGTLLTITRSFDTICQGIHMFLWNF